MPAKETRPGSSFPRSVGSQVVAELIVAGLRNLPSIFTYIYSISVFGIPTRHVFLGIALSFTLCMALLSPIVSHRSFAKTRGYGRAAEEEYLRRYWVSISLWFILLGVLGALLSYYFEMELVFQ